LWGRQGTGKSQVALNLGQSWSGKPAQRLGLLSFPQAIAFVWKVDARNVNKTQDIVVCC
jgi:hypothetical protein